MEVRLERQVNVTSPDNVTDILYGVLNAEPELDREKEHFWVIGLRSDNGLQFLEMVTLGTLTASLVHPREVFRNAIMKACASIIIAHNHPSGRTTPSPEDKTITKRMVTAGKLLDIPVLDHVIIGRQTNDSYYSFKVEGRMYG
jgi:DNA repair protein RadC